MKGTAVEIRMEGDPLEKGGAITRSLSAGVPGSGVCLLPVNRPGVLGRSRRCGAVIANGSAGSSPAGGPGDREAHCSVLRNSALTEPPESLPLGTLRVRELGELFRVTNAREIGVIPPAAEPFHEPCAVRGGTDLEAPGRRCKVGLEPAERLGAEPCPIDRAGRGLVPTFPATGERRRTRGIVTIDGRRVILQRWSLREGIGVEMRGGGGELFASSDRPQVGRLGSVGRPVHTGEDLGELALQLGLAPPRVHPVGRRALPSGLLPISWSSDNGNHLFVDSVDEGSGSRFSHVEATFQFAYFGPKPHEVKVRAVIVTKKQWARIPGSMIGSGPSVRASGAS